MSFINVCGKFRGGKWHFVLELKKWVLEIIQKIKHEIFEIRDF
jgi:hypothetical protein